MTDTTEVPPPEPRVYVHVEREEGDRYSILSSDLETIGAQLRGKARFSIFNSIILPALVTLVTLASTSLFQYISWQNSIRVQAASDEANAASKTFEQASSQSDKRFYATFLFNVAVKGIASRRASGDTKPDQLNKYDIDVQKKRYQDFYDQLVSWNQNYNQLLHNISYDLDRPLDKDRWTESAYSITKDALDNIKCDASSLAGEIARNKLDQFTIANHFAVINKCFAEAVDGISALKDLELADKDRLVGDDEYKHAYNRLDNVRSMLNQFRCYGLSRVHFLDTRKDRTVVFASWFVQEDSYVKAHRDDTEKKCAIKG
jgi:hypothetical protein